MPGKSLFQHIVMIDGEQCKMCSTCHEIKPLNEFGPELRRVSGKQAICLDCANRFRKRTAEDIKRHNLKYQHGITIEDYDRMYEAQEGKCGICKKLMTEPHVDHCHKSGKIRELLCGNCNLGIGNLQDDIEILLNAIEYVRKHNGSDDQKG